MAQAPQPYRDDDFIDLGRLLRAVLRYKWAIIALALTVTLVTGFVVYSMQPVYRASASIVLESQQANVVNVEEIYTLDTYDYNYTQTQFEILKSRALAERVVQRLNLQQHPYYAPAEAAEEETEGFSLSTLLPAYEKEPPVQLTEEEKEALLIQSITSDVSGSLSISPIEYSYVVYLNYESTDPKLAALIVNTLAEEFIESNLDNRLDGTLQATGWLEQRLAVIKENLRVSEQALQDFREQEGLVSVGGETGLGSSELASLSQRLEDARRSRIEAENIKADVQGMTAASTEELMTVPAVLQHQLIRDLKRAQSVAERKVAELGKRYGPKHPKMIAAESDLAASNEDLAREVRKVVSGINREYEVALRNEAQLQTTWETRKSELQDFNRVEFRLEELQREVDTNRELYNIFFNRIKSVSETGGFEKPHARVVDRAMVPSAPVKPNKRLSLMLAFVLGVMLGCGIAILLDMLDNTVKTPDDVEEKLHVPLLGILPKMKTDAAGDFESFWERDQGHYPESIRTIRTGILLSSLDDPAKIIVVTSTVPGEGKSSTTLNLAAAMGQMENILVIGADLRRPSLAKKCALAPNHKGLSHYVSGAAELEDCIERLEDKGFSIMPAGVIPANPLEMISTKKFADALESLKARFDRILIDTAPVQAVSDALIISSYADSVVYVVKADATSATAANKGISAIIGSNEPLTGVILNYFDGAKASRYYGAGKYYQYRDYYAGENTT